MIEKETTPDLKENFVNFKDDPNYGPEPFKMQIEVDFENSWGHYQEEGDKQVNWMILGTFKGRGMGKDYLSVYKGKALIRDNKVHFYDRYPCGGGPFKVSDFTDKKFRERSEIIAKNIEKILFE